MAKMFVVTREGKEHVIKSEDGLSVMELGGKLISGLEIYGLA